MVASSLKARTNPSVNLGKAPSPDAPRGNTSRSRILVSPPAWVQGAGSQEPVSEAPQGTLPESDVEQKAYGQGQDGVKDVTDEQPTPKQYTQRSQSPSIRGP